MNVFFILLYQCCAILLLFSTYSISGEYNILKTIPSFMYRKFDNVEEEIFPRDLRIKLSLSEISGTLVYSIDKHMNQLIVSLHNLAETNIKVEFRKSSKYFSLSELCGCENCQYKMLEIHIEISDAIKVQCNRKNEQNYQYSEEKALNSEYPVPYSEEKNNPQSPNEAHLWFVNTPRYNDLYPNPKQLLGCIFEVKYKNNPITFTSITNKIERKCRRRCVGNICNGGTCHETYNGRAVCNCTKTFLNGPKCNDPLRQINQRAYDLDFSVNLLKVSWKSMSKKIFTLSNKNVQIGLNYCGNNLLFNIHYLNDDNVIQNSMTLEGCVPNKEYIFIASFSEKNIEINYFNNEIWHFGHLASKIDLKNEIFTNLTLQSGNGKIDFTYKALSMNHKWKNVDIEKFEEIKNNSFPRKEKLLQKQTIENPQLSYIIKLLKRNNGNYNSNTIVIILIVGLVFLFILVGLLVYLLFKEKWKNRKYKASPSNDEGNLPLLSGNDENKKFEESILSTIISNFMESNKTNVEREKLINELKDYKGFCDNSTEKNKLINMLPEFVMNNCTSTEKIELYQLLHSKKFKFSEDENIRINTYLKVFASTTALNLC